MNLLLVAAGAAVGAPARYLTDRWIQRRHDSVFPWGTFAVNAFGSLILGFILGAVHVHAASGDLTLLIGTGFCGALTTFSTFGYETNRFMEDGAFGLALANVVASVGVGLGAAVLGWLAGSAL